LRQYAFNHRDQVWDDLHWAARRRVTPVVRTETWFLLRL
jgi:hypothetical protein